MRKPPPRIFFSQHDGDTCYAFAITADSQSIIEFGAIYDSARSESCRIKINRLSISRQLLFCACRFSRRCSTASIDNSAINWSWIIYRCPRPNAIALCGINSRRITCTCHPSTFRTYASINVRRPAQKTWRERIQQVPLVMILFFFYLRSQQR